MTKTLQKERKRRMGQGSSVPAKKSREDIDDSERESVQLIPHDELDIINDEVPRKHFIFGLRLPSQYWSCQTFQNKNIASYQTAEHHKNKVPPVAFTKIAVFEIGERNPPSCTIFLAGHLHCQRTVESEEEAQELLVYAEKLSVCCGVGNTSEFKRLDVSDCTTLSANGLFNAPTGSATARQERAFGPASGGWSSHLPILSTLAKLHFLRASMLNTLKPVCCQRAQVSAGSAVEGNPAVCPRTPSVVWMRQQADHPRISCPRPRQILIRSVV
ncbi:hypothetical protein HPB51_017126 [Rhipicephalus microplus]|uniref:Uncharacterized protein n=1 Tax=Rhipicephalus microplus TaxID=6941 RepID=A0A9J6ENQ2_RHIMP|nr:hypothetical protein HPB51_017126 [Rhipicephalus microplus]